jgi:hypothetical protein
MGNSFMGQVVPLDNVRSLYGSHNEEVFARLTASREDYVGYLMGRGSDLTDRETMARALRSILDGEPCTELRPFTYGYAVVAYCYEYGEKAFSIDTRDYMRAGETLSKFGLELGLDFWSLLTDKWPLPIPATPEYPLVGCIDQARCARYAQQLAVICKELELEEDDFFVPLRKGFEKAVASGRDVIVFNY